MRKPIRIFLKLKDAIQKILLVIFKLCFNIKKVRWFFCLKETSQFMINVYNQNKKNIAFQNQNSTIWLQNTYMCFCDSAKDKILTKKWWSRRMA